MNCPDCNRQEIVKNGSIHTGKQKSMCKACVRQFVENPQLRVISDETKALIDRLRLARLSLAGIARVTGVSERRLQTSVNQRDAQQPRQAQIRIKKTALDLTV